MRRRHAQARRRKPALRRPTALAYRLRRGSLLCGSASNNFPKDPGRADGSPEPAVIRLATVVAHHEVVAARNHDWPSEVTEQRVRAGNDVGVALVHAVADHAPVDDRNPVAGQTNHTLDELKTRPPTRRYATRPREVSPLPSHAADRRQAIGTTRRVKHHDIADLGPPCAVST